MTVAPSEYAALPRLRVSDGVVLLRPVRVGDIESIRVWRNAQMDVLRQASEITPAAQAEYFERHVWPQMLSATPAQVLVAIESGGRMVGYGGLVHVSWPYRRAELSFLLRPELESDDAALEDHFSRYLRLIRGVAFGSLGLRRLCTETYANRTRHIRMLEAAGFRLEGRLRGHVLVAGAPMDSLMHGLLASDPVPPTAGAAE